MNTRKYFLRTCLAALLTASSAFGLDPVPVEIDLLPSVYSVESIRFRSLLEKRSSLRPRTFRRLKFGTRNDEISYSLKTGNAPDILLLGLQDYRRMAQDGYLVDLSGQLLRLPDAGSDTPNSAWTPLRQADSCLFNTLVQDGRIFAFPGKRRTYGLLMRRSQSGTEDSGDQRLTLQRIAELAANAATGSAGPSIALALNPELLAYLAIADFGVKSSAIDQKNREELSRAAVSSIVSVSTAVNSMIHDRIGFCAACGRAKYLPNGGGVSECDSCGTADVRLKAQGSAGVLTADRAAAVDLFMKRRVKMVLCARDDIYPLIDAGVSPGEMIFLPIAGAEYIPDMEILSIYSGVSDREGGDERTAELTAFLKDYSSQFLVPEDSPLYLWHERALISHLIRRGYSGLFSADELDSVSDLRAVVDREMPEISSEQVSVEKLISVDEFFNLAGLSGFTHVERLFEYIRDGRAIGLTGGNVVEKTRAAYMGAGFFRLLLFVLLVGLLGVALAGAGTASPKKSFRACVSVFSRVALILLIPLLLVLLLKLCFTIIGASISIADLINNPPVIGGKLGVIVREVTGSAVDSFLAVMTSVVISVLLALSTSFVLVRMRGWRVIVSFFLVLPVCLAGFWGTMFLDAAGDWLSSAPYAVDSAGAVLWMRVVSIAWATMPFACMAYLYRLRRIGDELYDAARLDGASSSDAFFAVTWPSLMPAVVLHSLTVALLVITGSSGALLGSDAPVGSGFVLRKFLFSEDQASLVLLNGFTVLSVLLPGVWALRRFYAVEVRETFSGKTT